MNERVLLHLAEKDKANRKHIHISELIGFQHVSCGSRPASISLEATVEVTHSLLTS